MPAIPLVVLLARERAASFRRCVEMLHATWQDPPSRADRDEAVRLVTDFPWYRATYFGLESPFVVVDRALRWAMSDPPPPVSMLREARELMEAMASDWEAAVLLMHKMETSRLENNTSNWSKWVNEATNIATSESLRIRHALRVSWPVDSEEEEKKTLDELKSGGGFGLEEAFAKIAGISEKELKKRVQAHKKKWK